LIILPKCIKIAQAARVGRDFAPYPAKRERQQEVICLKSKTLSGTRGSVPGDTRKLALAGILTAIVIVLQVLSGVIRFGTFQPALALIPIIVGAATCGAYVSAWLGFVFGVVVLLNGDAALFMG
jgi:hypothetical protein